MTIALERRNRMKFLVKIPKRIKYVGPPSNSDACCDGYCNGWA